MSTPAVQEWRGEKEQDLLTAILSLESKSEAARFLRDLLTESEIREISNRWAAARMLADGVSYRNVTALTGLSSTTVARISKWLGSEDRERCGTGGYSLILNRISPSDTTRGRAQQSHSNHHRAQTR